MAFDPSSSSPMQMGEGDHEVVEGALKPLSSRARRSAA
jgi:hypothetical protein